MISRITTILLLVVASLACLAAPPPSAVYSLTLAKGAAGGGDLAVRVVTTLGTVTEWRAGDAAADVAGVTVDATGLRGDAKVGADLWTLDATIQGEKVTGKWRGTVGGKALNGTLTGTVQARDALPYGHADFYPSPEHPVYFRQTYGDYPGATPPLEWWEGTPTTRKVVKAEFVDFADQKSKNILWRMPVPGWSLSHPIVVGKRVLAVGEPDFVTCWDLDSGKQLWQRRMMPLLLDGLPAEKAAAGQKILDLARAFFYIGTGGFLAGRQHNNLFGGLNKDGSLAQTQDPAAFMAEKRQMAERYLEALAPHRADVEVFGDAALLAALDKDLEIIKRCQAATDLDAFNREAKFRPVNLIGACLQRLGVDIGGYWWGYVGSADSTLASDGERLYGVFDQGQVFCLDLDGNLLWGKREKGGHDNRGAFHRSPLLCDGLLLVRSFTGKGNIRPLRAFDTATGELHWEAPLAGSNYTIPRLMRLKDPAGADVDVLIGDDVASREQGQQIVRVRDGKVIGHLPYQPCGRGALMAVFGQQVTWYSIDDRGGGPNCSYRLRLEGADTVVAEKVFVLEGRERVLGGQDFPTVAGTALLNGAHQLFDATTGTLISKLPVQVGPLRVSDGRSLSVGAGHYLITMTGGDNDGLYGRGGPGSRGRDDHMASCEFTVLDIKDPAKPVVVAKNNLLGYKEPAADIIVSTYFKGFDPYDFAGCYKGSASYFALMGGPVPVGNKLLIQTSAYLYCIGEK